MAGAVSAVLYIVLTIEPEETGVYKAAPMIRVPHFLNKYNAFRYRMKARILFLFGQIPRLKISDRLIGKPGHTT